MPQPEVNSQQFAITDTIYISPIGNDSNPGSMQLPMKSFKAAMQALPFGTPGINEGHAFGLIRALPGTYYLNEGWQQGYNQYELNGTFKNISVEGIGQVYLKPLPGKQVSGHLIRLQGSHISVKNLSLTGAAIHGVLIRNDQKNVSHVILEDLKIDSAQSFSILLYRSDTVLINRCSSYYAARSGFDTLPNPCSWPSGMKAYQCSYVWFNDCEIAYTRGEGLNFHNTHHGLASNNRLHNNPTQLYIDNSSYIKAHNNFIYATDDKRPYWYTCPNNTNPRYGPTGILLANEGACTTGGPNYINCQTVCALDQKSFEHVNEVDLWNNLIVNCTPALSLWQGNTDLGIQGYNCMRNVRFVFNTISGVIGDPNGGNYAQVYAYFPSAYNPALGRGYASIENMTISNNVFSFDTLSFPAVRLFRAVQDPNFPSPLQIYFENNITKKAPANTNGLNHHRPLLVTDTTAQLNQLKALFKPCPGSEIDIKAPLPAYITSDFDQLTRINPSMVGALEFTDHCSTSLSENPYKPENWPTLHPNPCYVPCQINWSYTEGARSNYTITNLEGRALETDHAHKKSPSITIPGLYLLTLEKEGALKSYRLIVLP